MPCERPRIAYQGPCGGPIYFIQPGGPGFNSTFYQEVQLPCGYCDLCVAEKARQTAVRIYHEAHNHETNCFATFTYTPEHLPENSSLQYSDMQKFYKRLRKRMGIPLRHFTVGEYGDKGLRPHYHACIFGHAFTEGRRILRTLPTLLWTTQELEECWGLGYVSIGALNFQTAAYTASYVTKKLHAKQQYVYCDEQTGELIPLEQPRARASRYLARAWLEKYGDLMYAHDEIVIDGQPQKPPRQYDEWLKKRSRIAIAMIKEKRKKEGKHLTPEQLHARAENARARKQAKVKTI